MTSTQESNENHNLSKTQLKKALKELKSQKPPPVDEINTSVNFYENVIIKIRSRMTTLITKNSTNEISGNTVKLFLNRKAIKFCQT